MKIINPHDKFFKETFSKKEEARDLILHILPKQLSNRIDITSLELDKTSYVDEELKENFSDIVYNCRYNKTVDIKISFLIEHKSYRVDYPHIQLLKYLLKIWETNIKQKQVLTPVIPIIIYHGKHEWNKQNFIDYFPGIDENIKCFLPIFDYLLTDLSKYSDEDIMDMFNTITVTTSLLLLKNIFNEIILEQKLPIILSDINTILKTEKGEKFLISVLFYIFANTEIDNEEITKSITLISNKGGQIAMTTATKLRKEGIKEGWKEGRKEDIVNLYQHAKISIMQIVDYLKVDRLFVENALKEKGLI